MSLTLYRPQVIHTLYTFETKQNKKLGVVVRSPVRYVLSMNGKNLYVSLGLLTEPLSISGPCTLRRVRKKW